MVMQQSFALADMAQRLSASGLTRRHKEEVMFLLRTDSKQPPHQLMSAAPDWLNASAGNKRRAAA